MLSEDIPDFSSYLAEWSRYLQLLRQNWLLDELSFITFAKEKGIDVWGVVRGDPGEFHAQGWLTSDGFDPYGDPSFHPFRLYPLHQILRYGRLGIAASCVIRNERVQEVVEHCLSSVPNQEHIARTARDSNRIADFAVLLEPIYWPRVIGVQSWNDSACFDEGGRVDAENKLGEYRVQVLDLVRTLDPEAWKAVHEDLRTDAGRLDRNDELYLLLRLSNWDRRKRLIGRLGASLWLRHIAEVIRRAFEEVHSVQWFEEDRTSGMWYPGGRKFAYGAERPLDNTNASRPYLAWGFNLLTGSALRWYVEGTTEHGAVIQALQNPSGANVEVVNLRGNIANERDNAAMKLGEWLKEDKAQRRFSMISFDVDVAANVRAIRRQVEQNSVVGYIAANRPDFEFANFTVCELAAVAAELDEEAGYPGDPVRGADWTDISKAADFEAKYKLVSARHPQSLKGEEWGRALAKYIRAHPNREDTNAERPFSIEIGVALRARFANYDFQSAAMRFDPNTFEAIDLRVEVEGVERAPDDQSS